MRNRTGPKPVPLIERVMRRVTVADSGCWLWTGSVTQGGYGQVFTRDGAAVNISHPTHRVVYEHFVGPIGYKVDLHHHCRVRRCCNPEHLEPVHHSRHAEHHKSDECRACGSSDWYFRKDNGSRQCRVCATRRRRTYAPEPKPFVPASGPCRACGHDDWYPRPDGGRNCRECPPSTASRWRENNKREVSR